MNRRQVLGMLSAAVVASTLSFSAAAAEILTIVVPFSPGASADVTTRLVAQKVSENTGLNIVIENRPGSNGIIAAEAVKRAAPDGRTLLLANIGTNAMNETLYERVPYTAADFAPVTTLWQFPSVLVVPAASPIQSVDDLVKMARESQYGLNYGSAGPGSGPHIMGALLQEACNVDMVHVPYRGVAPALIDLMAGRLDFMFSSYASVQSQVESGDFRALAVAADNRLAALPDLPTLKELGLGDNLELQQWFGIAAPAGVDPEVIAKLHEMFVTAVQDPVLIQRLDEQGIEVITMEPAEFAAFIDQDTERLGKVLRAIGAEAG